MQTTVAHLQSPDFAEYSFGGQKESKIQGKSPAALLWTALQHAVKLQPTQLVLFGPFVNLRAYYLDFDLHAYYGLSREALFRRAVRAYDVVADIVEQFPTLSISIVLGATDDPCAATRLVESGRLQNYQAGPSSCPISVFNDRRWRSVQLSDDHAQTILCPRRVDRERHHFRHRVASLRADHREIWAQPFALSQQPFTTGLAPRASKHPWHPAQASTSLDYLHDGTPLLAHAVRGARKAQACVFVLSPTVSPDDAEPAVWCTEALESSPTSDSAHGDHDPGIKSPLGAPGLDARHTPIERDVPTVLPGGGCVVQCTAPRRPDQLTVYTIKPSAASATGPKKVAAPIRVVPLELQWSVIPVGLTTVCPQLQLLPRRTCTEVLDAPPLCMQRQAPLVILDRDGVINTLPSYSTGPDAMELVDGAADAILRLKLAGHRILVVSSQSCVGYGYVTEPVVDSVMDRMCELLRSAAAVSIPISRRPSNTGEDDGDSAADMDMMAKLEDVTGLCWGVDAVPDAIRYSRGTGSEHSAASPGYEWAEDAKPQPLLLQVGAASVGMEDSLAGGGGWMVGDRVTDLMAGLAAGVTPILVLTGGGLDTYSALRADDQPAATEVQQCLTEQPEWGHGTQDKWLRVIVPVNEGTRASTARAIGSHTSYALVALNLSHAADMVLAATCVF